MRTKIKLYLKKKSGSVLILAVLSVVILFALGLGLLSIAYGVRNRATKLKNEVVAMLAAEAGYEQAIFWMGQQQDMLSALQEQASGLNDTLSFPGATCDYEIELFTFVDFRPVYRILSTGHSGVFNRTVDVYVIQAISGWDMGLCRVPLGKNKTTPVYFVDDEIIDMPVYINDLKDSPDNRDIYIDGEPQFLNRVGMGESRYTDNDYDKYMSVMDLFESGIYFDQPDCKITDEATIQSKLNRFKNSTKSEYRFTPAAGSEITNPHPAVQLEFFVENGVGKVRITNNCTVRGYQRNSDDNTLDFKIKPDTDGEEYQRYLRLSFYA